MTVARKQFHFVLLTLISDSLAIVLSFLGAYLIRFASGLVPILDVPPPLIYAKSLVVIVPVYLWLFRAYGLYEIQRNIRRVEEIFTVAKAVTFSVIILTAATFFYREWTYSRLFLVIMWVLSIVFISLSRYVLIQWEYARKRRKHDLTRVLLLGANRNTRNVIKWAKANPHYGQEIIGVLAREVTLAGKHFEGIPVLGVSDQAENFILHLRPDQVVLLDPEYSRDQVTDLVVTCEDLLIDFKVAADFYGLMTRNVDVEYISTVPLLGFHSLPLDDFWNRLIKRWLDLSVSVALVCLTFPIWVMVMLAIQLDDGGPIFYRQERIGRDLAQFSLFKFRTMKADAEKETGPVWARPNDSRRTRIGNVLRRWNLDELPQLLNVIKGEMSLVGPRPERPHFIAQFRNAIPRYMARHKVKSGLTGWAQVNGYRGSSSLQERIKYDLYYMENWSLLFDIEILFMTFFAFKNAY